MYSYLLSNSFCQLVWETLFFINTKYLTIAYHSLSPIPASAMLYSSKWRHDTTIELLSVSGEEKSEIAAETTKYLEITGEVNTKENIINVLHNNFYFPGFSEWNKNSVSFFIGLKPGFSLPREENRQRLFKNRVLRFIIVVLLRGK